MRNRAVLILPLVLAACVDDSSRPNPLIPESAAASAGVPSRTKDDPGSWSNRSTGELWSFAAAGDSTFLIGLKAPGTARGVWRDRPLLSAAELQLFHRALLSRSGVELVSYDPVIPMVRVKIADHRTLDAVRALAFVDYLEPATGPRQPQTGGPGGSNASVHFSSDSDRSTSCSTPAAYSNFYGQTAQGDWMSWNFEPRFNNVVRAWARSQGDNIRVALLDTGVDAWQPQLTTRFNANPEAVRHIWYDYTDPSSFIPRWADDCGHGTRVAGIVGAPMDGQSTVGIAWKSDLISIRVDDDVIVSGYSDVINAIHKAMDPTRPAHIINMGFWGYGLGPGSTSEPTADVIRHYYYRTDASGRRNGPLFIAAAGTDNVSFTSNGWVVFPARMPEVVAVSAVNANWTLNSSSHYGPQIELAGFVPHATIGTPGPFPSSPEITRLMGSSGGSASVAGIAALVWARYPHLTNVEIREHLKRSASHYPNRTDHLGYGTLHANKAVGGFSGLSISGPTGVYPYTTHTFTAHPRGDGPFLYQWSNGATTPNTTYAAGGQGWLIVRVDVTDVVENRTETIVQHVQITDGSYTPPCDPNLDPMCPT